MKILSYALNVMRLWDVHPSDRGYISGRANVYGVGVFAHSLVMRLNTSEDKRLTPLPNTYSGRAHEHLYLTECDA